MSFPKNVKNLLDVKYSSYKMFQLWFFLQIFENSYILKSGRIWNDMESPSTSWKYMELAVTTWNKVKPPVTRQTE